MTGSLIFAREIYTSYYERMGCENIEIDIPVPKGEVGTLN